MTEPGRLKRSLLWGASGVVLLGGVLVFWVAGFGKGPGVDLYPGDYVGQVPDHPLVEVETYPRLVPWELDSLIEENSITVLRLSAQSYACNLEGGEQVTETFHRVESRETADTVTIETWLGPPNNDGFWRHCVGTGWGFPVRLELNSPLGDRELVDPACALDRYADLIACKESKLVRTR